jgi:hypothetical protein
MEILEDVPRLGQAGEEWRLTRTTGTRPEPLCGRQGTGLGGELLVPQQIATNGARKEFFSPGGPWA